MLLVLGVLSVTCLIGGVFAGPFYECQLGSEKKYRVNLCVDRCPEVGTSRGCSGNRTCCLVGCARICFNQRQTANSPNSPHLEEPSINGHSPLVHYIRQVDNKEDSAENDTTSAETDFIASTNNELKDFSPGLAQFESSGDGDGPSPSQYVTAPSATNRHLSTPLQVLGKLRFSSVLDKFGDKAHPIQVKSVQQWNGVTDNIVNALDDAHVHAARASRNGGDSAVIWQIFEFLRLIQAKLDNINNPTFSGRNLVRSKPPLSPNDPNILMRKTLSDFMKTLNKIQSELNTLSVGQQQVVRILERVFVNQLRLANVGAPSGLPSTRRQQRWQKQQETLPVLNQLTPLAEAAVLLDNTFLIGGFDTSNCYRLNGCSFDVCRMTKCAKYPQATCRINSCRNCEAEFFIGNAKVRCN